MNSTRSRKSVLKKVGRSWENEVASSDEFTQQLFAQNLFRNNFVPQDDSMVPGILLKIDESSSEFGELSGHKPININTTTRFIEV